MSFGNTVKKGDIGESIVKRIVKNMGFLVYSVENEGSHPFDFILVHRESFKMMLFDVKTVARRNKYDDNGLDLDDWNYYWEWKKKTGLDFFILFVDEMLEKVYGNRIEELNKPYYDKKRNIVYPLIYRGEYSSKIYLPLSRMKHIADISSEEAEYIRSFAQRNHAYEWLKNREKGDGKK